MIHGYYNSRKYRNGIVNRRVSSIAFLIRNLMMRLGVVTPRSNRPGLSLVELYRLTLLAPVKYELGMRTPPTEEAHRTSQ